MEVHHEGKFLVVGCELGTVESSGDTGFRYDDDVCGYHAGLRIKSCGRDLGAEESLDGSVFVYPEVGNDLMNNFWLAVICRAVLLTATSASFLLVKIASQTLPPFGGGLHRISTGQGRA